MHATRFAALVGGLGLFAGVSLGQGIVQPLFETGFEADDDPAYLLGDLQGQNGWMVVPGLAEGLVQDAVVRTGLQAVSLADGASYARAQQGIATSDFGVVLMSDFAMLADSAWATIPDEVQDRFEAHQRLEFTDAGEVAWGLEYGLITTNVDYGPLAPGDVAYYIEIGSEEAMLASTYTLIDPADALDAWHFYEMRFDRTIESNVKAIATLFVDGEPVASVGIDRDFTSLNVMQLENQRWGSSPNNNEPLYFDDVVLGPMGCAADLNGDGALDVLDFVLFQQYWVAQDAIGDCDGNGSFDVLDFVCYSGLFQQGCEF